jgi:hypothetical protein
MSSALRPTINLEGQVPVFMTPSDRVARLYPQAAGSLLAPYYDTQGYAGGNLTRPHTRLIWDYRKNLHCGTDTSWLDSTPELNCRSTTRFSVWQAKHNDEENFR